MALFIRWVIAALYIALLFSFAGQQQSGAGTMHLFFRQWFPWLTAANIQTMVFIIRKAGHVGAYFFGTALFYSAAVVTPWCKRHAKAVAFVLALALAVADEGYQRTLPHRTGSSVDVLIDGLGILCAIALIHYFSRSREKITGGEEIRDTMANEEESDVANE